MGNFEWKIPLPGLVYKWRLEKSQYTLELDTFFVTNMSELKIKFTDEYLNDVDVYHLKSMFIVMPKGIMQ